MKRRSRAGSDPGKARRRKTVAPKRASAPKAVPRRSSSAGDMESKIAQLTGENARLVNELRQRTTDLSKALEQQRVASEVLQAISGFPGDLEPVFASMLQNAVRILRRKVWKYLSLGRRHPAPRCCIQYAARIRRGTRQHAASASGSENSCRPHGRD